MMKGNTSFRSDLAALVLAVAAAASPGAGADGGIEAITARLPGAYEGVSVLEGAERVAVTVMRPATSVAPFGEIRYLTATYEDSESAATEFNALIPGDYVSHGSWQIVLHARDVIHWLSGICEISEEQFRDLYAGAVEHAGSGPVDGAYLCQCDSGCRRVAVDR